MESRWANLRFLSHSTHLNVPNTCIYGHIFSIFGGIGRFEKDMEIVLHGQWKNGMRLHFALAAYGYIFLVMTHGFLHANLTQNFPPDIFELHTFFARTLSFWVIYEFTQPLSKSFSHKNRPTSMCNILPSTVEHTMQTMWKWKFRFLGSFWYPVYLSQSVGTWCNAWLKNKYPIFISSHLCARAISRNFLPDCITQY